LKNLHFKKLKPETQTALLNDPLIASETGALRVYVPSRRQIAPAVDVVRFYCACVIASDPTPTASTAKRYGITPRRVRQLTEKVRAGAEPFPLAIPDSDAMQLIDQAKSESALDQQLESGSRLFDPSKDNEE